jgi:hypothetical protein
MKKQLRKLAFVAMIMMGGLAAFAQVTNEGSPKSWELSNLKSTSPVVMSGFDLDAMIAEDALTDHKGQAYRFGKELSVELGIANAGTWEELDNGDGIWRINILSEGAKSINFIFDEFKMPEGGSVYLYSEDRENLVGAYTNVMNLDEETLGTWWVTGDNVWVEYYEPKAVRGQGKLNIGTVVHGYRSVTDSDIFEKGLNDSGACNLDVDCTIGSDFDPIKEMLKHSVGLIIGGGSLCSGTLLNNTSLDKTPYFLFANHCGFSAATSAVRFNWISPNPVCAQNTNSSNASFNSTSGATLLSTNSQSDYRLFRLEGGIDPSWDMEWAGWDATDEVPDYTIGIHHPAGDIMKVCRNDTGNSKRTSGGQIFWQIDPGSGGGWEFGVTEGGSSGSGLFNESGQLIGTLCCGSAACSGTSDNGALDLYGRFAISYVDNGLDQWLDPTGSGDLTLGTLTEELQLSVGESVLSTQISVYPNPTSGILNIKNTSGENLNYVLYNIIGQSIAKGTINGVEKSLDLSSQVSGVYFLSMTDANGTTSASKKIIINK